MAFLENLTALLLNDQQEYTAPELNKQRYVPPSNSTFHTLFAALKLKNSGRNRHGYRTRLQGMPLTALKLKFQSVAAARKLKETALILNDRKTGTAPELNKWCCKPPWNSIFYETVTALKLKLCRPFPRWPWPAPPTPAFRIVSCQNIQGPSISFMETMYPKRSFSDIFTALRLKNTAFLLNDPYAVAGSAP